MIFNVHLKTPADARTLNDIAFDYGEKMLVSADLNYIDARSLLALYTLIGEKISLVFPDHCDKTKLKPILKKLAVLA